MKRFAYSIWIGLCLCLALPTAAYPFTIILEESNANKWFGGDDRQAFKPRNVGVGQGITFGTDVHLTSTGFKYLRGFTYSTNPGAGNQAGTLVLNFRRSDGSVISTYSTTFTNQFNGGWILFDIDEQLSAGTYIFTCYLQDGEILEFNTGVLGHTDDLLLDSQGYSGQITEIGGDLEDWNNWFEHPWDFNFQVTGSNIQDCILALAATYTSGILALEFELGTPGPATWSTWLIVGDFAIPLWSVPLRAIDPSITVPLSFPFPSGFGTMAFVTTLSTEGEGIICLASALVNTS